MTDRNKQIKELAKVIYSMFRSDNMSRAMASMLYAKGYRKASEVAEEIFADLKRCKPVMAYDELIALKKKYLGENNNG